MSAALFAVPRAAWQGSRNAASRPAWLLGLGLLVALPVVLAALGWDRAALAALVSIALVMVVGLWMILVYSVLQQNQPLLARIVPGHVSRLRQGLWGPWFLVGAVAGILSAWHRGTPLAYGTPTLVIFLTLAWTARWPVLWALIWIPTSLAPLAFRYEWVRSVWDAVAAQAEQRPWLALLALAALGAWLLGRLVDEGGARHEQRYQTRQIWRRSMREPGYLSTQWQPGSLIGRLQHLQTRLYRRVLARRLAQGRGGVDRLLLGIGPQAHWSGQTGQSLIFAAIFGLVMLGLFGLELIGVFPPRARISGLGNAAFGAVAYTASIAIGMYNALTTRRDEQALLMLAPGGPRGPALNRALARTLLLQLMLQFLLVFGVVGLLLQRWADAQDQLLAFGLASLPIGFWLWRDWSRARAGRALLQALWVMLPMAGGGLGLLALHQGWIGRGSLVLFWLGLTLLFALWRWRRVIGSPAALPTGRRA